jgi:superfamily II DNA helicase RecQ
MPLAGANQLAAARGAAVPPGADAGLDTALRRLLGLEGWMPGQREVVRALLNGRSACAVLPGGGRAVCYQLPALMMPRPVPGADAPPLTLVVSPNVNMMREQLNFLRQRGPSPEPNRSPRLLSEARRAEHVHASSSRPPRGGVPHPPCCALQATRRTRWARRLA